MVGENKVRLLGIHYLKSLKVYIGLLGFSKNFHVCFHTKYLNMFFFLIFKSHLYILQMFNPKYFLFRK